MEEVYRNVNAENNSAHRFCFIKFSCKPRRDGAIKYFMLVEAGWLYPPFKPTTENC